MSTSSTLPIPAASVDDFLDLVLANANPNPCRHDCPARSVLRELAMRKRPLGDPAYEHLGRCSPCYREFRAIQKAGAGRGGER